MGIKTELYDELLLAKTVDNANDGGVQQGNLYDTWNEGRKIDIKNVAIVTVEGIIDVNIDQEFKKDVLKDVIKIKEEDDVKWKNHKWNVTDNCPPFKVEQFEAGVCSYAQWKADQSLTINIEASPRTSYMSPSRLSKPQLSLPSNTIQQQEHGNRKILKNNEVIIMVEKKVFYKRNFVCNTCFYVFPSYYFLKKHIFLDKSKLCFKNRSVELNKKPQNDLTSLKNSKTHFGCNRCGLKCVNKCSLREHKFVHINEKAFSCGLCDFKSFFKSQLKTHEMSHTGEKPFKCDKCSYKCALSFALKKHKMSHTGEKPYKCELCDFKSAYASNFKAHKLIHSGLKEFKCDLCNFRSSFRSQLKRHSMSHTGEKPFKCDQCDYKSALSFSLKNHKLSHTGEKPFKCEKCSFESVYANNFKAHVLRHRLEKPYRCDKCDFKTTFQSQFKMHLITHIQNNS